MEKALVDVRGDMAALRGTLDSWDRSVDRMAEYQRSHAMLQEVPTSMPRHQELLEVSLHVGGPGKKVTLTVIGC